ncbi:MAG: type II toxin-antitoxin system HipA family toxin [Actinobacteria bacterium]|nr:type II toxin-antitoxin system HipA family toxin [Actinomycetota bacterium]
MADELDVWLYGIRVASVRRQGGRLRLAYTDDAFERFPLGAPLLSMSLPLTSGPHSQGVVRPFLDGLLPEGESRAVVANDFGVYRDDTFGLVRALGRECAGAVVIQPAGEGPPPPATTLTAERLSETDIESLVADLRSAPLGVGERVRISLAGVQEKLLLTRMPDGSWGRPVDGTPSTHIIKPAIDRFPGSVENEAFCMRLARNLELPCASVETMMVGDRKVLVVQRYDRAVAADGSVERIHQEDMCQALSIVADRKYESDGGPSLRQIAELLQVATRPDSLEALLRAVTLNVAIGNDDAHGKNFSLLHDPQGVIRLAPLYDLLSTSVYDVSNQLAMFIDTVQRMERVTSDRIVNEAVGWGMSANRARGIVEDLIDRIPLAADHAAEKTEGLSPAVIEVVESQIKHLGP